MMKNNGSIKKIPLSAIQEQFWILNQLHSEGTAYHVPSLFRIKGRLNISVLEKAINAIIDRHEVFRTSFVYEEEVTQHVFSEMLIKIDVKQMKQYDTDSIQTIIHNEVNKPFDLSTLPLFRVTFFQADEGDSFLLINMHHIIIDLHTKDLFSNELNLLYNAYINNNSAQLPEVETQYGDFAKWQKEWINQGEHLPMLSYWEKQLENHEELLSLPIEKKRPAVLSQAGSCFQIDLDSQIIEKLKRFSRRNNVNIYLTLLTSYFILLYRYTGQNTVTLGVPLTNRRQNGFKNTMGCFVNTLPLTISMSAEETFLEILRKVRYAMLGAHRNQEAPFVSIVNHVEHKKDSSFNALFQAGFTFEHPMEISFEGVETDSVFMHNQGSQLDIFATFWESGTKIRGVFEYNSDLFDEAFAKQLSESFYSILNGLLNESELSLLKLPILPETEKNKLLDSWNDTAVVFDDVDSVHGLFEQQVIKSPDAVAVQFKDQSLTYIELNRKANQLASFLCEQDGAVGDFIGIFMERSLEMLIALLGVLKAGRAYVPIDPTFPADRIQYMISHSEIAAVLTSEQLKDSIPSKAIHIYTDSDWKNFKRINDSALAVKLMKDSLAYVIYTSGSTGKPKGVQVQHSAVVNFLNSMANRPGICSQDALLAVTTLSFDIAVLELFLPLTVGAKTVIAPQEAVPDGSELLNMIEEYGVTIMQATPVTFRLLINAGWNADTPLKVLCGGEAMPVDLAEKLTERSNDVWNMYGPTETTVWSTCWKLTKVDGSVSVGTPIANTKIYVLNEQMEPVPIGVPGNLYIGGQGLTLGYLKQRELTDEKFLKNPFIKGLEEKIYNTGDIAKYRRDGSLEIVGRADFQLKVNGFRIESGEIETMLDSYPGITQTAVTIYVFDENDSRLVAYYTKAENVTVDSVDLRNYLAEKLPDYMIPALFLKIDSMPLTPNGKVDRKKLPKPEYKRPDNEKKLSVPTNQLEKSLCDIWCRVLKIDSVGVNEKFFEVGGTSLLGVQIIDKIQKELKIKVPVIEFYKYPTIVSFASYLSTGEGVAVEKKKNQDRAMLRKKSLKRIRERAALRR